MKKNGADNPAVDKISELVGQKLKEIRLLRGMTQEELAHNAGILPIQVSTMELGKRSPTVRTLYKVAEGLNVNMSDIVDVERKYVEEEAEDYLSGEILKLLRQLKKGDQERLLGIVRTLVDWKVH